MSSRRSSNLVVGKPSISRLYCSRCKEETLHHYRRCNHCGREQPVASSWEDRFCAKRTGMNAKRGGSKKMSRTELLRRLKHETWLLSGQSNSSFKPDFDHLGGRST